MSARAADVRTHATCVILHNARLDRADEIRRAAGAFGLDDLTDVEVDLVARMIRQADITVTIPTTLEDE